MLISSTCLGIATAVNILQWALKRKEAFISPVVKENYLVKLIQKSFEETIHERAYIHITNPENGPIRSCPILISVNGKFLPQWMIS